MIVIDYELVIDYEPNQYEQPLFTKSDNHDQSLSRIHITVWTSRPALKNSLSPRIASIKPKQVRFYLHLSIIPKTLAQALVGTSGTGLILIALYTQTS